jgi:RNA polymerase sigma-70 factor, ECF subfamily
LSDTLSMLRAMPDARRQTSPAGPAGKPVLRPVSDPVSAPTAPAADDDTALCARVAQGDEEAFEGLVLRYQDRVYGFCFRVLGDRTEAEDVAQDVFLTLYRSAGEFRAESQFSTWLLRIAKNQALNRLKYLDRRGRSTRRSIEEVSEERLLLAPDRDEPKSADMVIELGETAAIVQGAIATLEPMHRAVVVLRDVEELSYEEISGITGLPIGTVKSRIHRGRSALAERLMRIFR